MCQMGLSFLVYVLCALFISGKASASENDSFTFYSGIAKEAQTRIIKASFRNPEMARFTHVWTESRSHLLSPPTNLPKNASLQLSSPLQLFVYNQCELDLIYTIFSGQPWAFQMFDAFGKPRTRLLQGSVNWVGGYDECLQVSAPPDKGYHSKGFRGRYAMVSLVAEGNSQLLGSISMGACFPSSCAEDDNFNSLYTSVLNYLKKLPIIKDIVAKLPVLKVTFVPKRLPLDTGGIICICLCAVFTILVLLGTSVDAFRRIKQTKPQKIDDGLESCSKTSHEENLEEHERMQLAKDQTNLMTVCKANMPHPKCVGQDFLLCFSAITNTESVLDTSSSQEQLQCLHGIRFLSMSWVILGHTYVMGIVSFGNLADVVKCLDTWPFQVVMEGTYSVDTFFLLSGCLLTFLFLKNENRFSTLNHWIQFYVHRYVRLTPVYAMALFVFATWWNSLSSGPFWTTVNMDTCSKSWWWNLIYVNNFVSVNNMCMAWSWYLANDMQFFVISPLFLLAFKRKRIVGLVVVATLLVASWTATGIISRVDKLGTLFNDLDVTANPEEANKKQTEVFDKIYEKPYTRIGPYLIGVFLGYILNEVKGMKNFLNKWLVILGWIGSQTLALALIYGLYRVQLDITTQSAIVTLSRTAWGISVAWVIFACLTGHAGPVNTFLSWKMWIPLSRLTYCAYLVHPMIMYWYYYSLRDTLYFTNSLVVVNYLSFMVLSYGMAFLTSLVFEAPVMKLEKFVKRL